MNSEDTVVLYTRSGCHLCEQVEKMLQMLSVNWTPVDIETNPELEKNYGLSIPVLFLPGSGQELAFPFDVDALALFLGKETP